MRTITLELLRHGPAHNQLLSPLTDYLALCENHSAVSLQVPFEHNQMLYRLRALCYHHSDESREFQLIDTARMIGNILGKIPGLTAGLNRYTAQSGQDNVKNANSANSANGQNNDGVIHLRLILSASELALLPFELALASDGFPGAGQHLTLQLESPICITRETRRIASEFLAWPKRPKILFVFASPPGLEEVPAPAHLLALRQAIIPWLPFADDDLDQLDPNQRASMVAEYLDVLPYATVDALEKKCASGNYSHIHILAHGVDIDTAYDKRYGLALHSDIDSSGREVVTGERLSTILRSARSDRAGTFSRPSVVTLASCNGGNVGTVAGVGASIGHALHEAGIPMVIASQFPLSFGGSVMLVQDLYQGLLWGEDPRKLLVGLRRRLYANFTDTHDWASLIAYTTLPPDFDAQLVQARIQQACLSIEAALKNADDMMQQLDCNDATNNAHENQLKHKAVRKFGERAAPAKQRLLDIMQEQPDQARQILGNLASIQKREAQLAFCLMGGWECAGSEAKKMLAQLEQARAWYWEAETLESAHAGYLVQYLSLTLLLHSIGRILLADNRPEREILALWQSAVVRTHSNIARLDVVERAWAYGNLAELFLLAPLVPDLKLVYPRQDFDEYFARQAVEAASMISILTGPVSVHTQSTRRQMLRYGKWYGRMSQSFAGLKDTADNMLKHLPEHNPIA